MGTVETTGTITTSVADAAARATDVVASRVTTTTSDETLIVVILYSTLPLQGRLKFYKIGTKYEKYII